VPRIDFKEILAKRYTGRVTTETPTRGANKRFKKPPHGGFCLFAPRAGCLHTLRGRIQKTFRYRALLDRKVPAWSEWSGTFNHKFFRHENGRIKI